MATNQETTPKVAQNEPESDFVQLNSEDALKEFDWDKEKSNTQIGNDDNEEIEIIPEIEAEVDEIEEETEEEAAEREAKEAKETPEEKEARLKTTKKPEPSKKENKEEKAARLEAEEKAKIEGKESLSILAEELLEDGILEYAKVPKKDKLTSQELKTVVEQEVEGRVDAGLKEMFEGLDETAVAFLKHMKDGGKAADFIEVHVDNAIPENLNLDKEKEQKAFLSYYLETREELDEESISDRLEWLKDKGKLESEAKKLYIKAQKEQELAKEELQKKTQSKAKKDEADRLEFAQTLVSTLDKKEALGIKLTDKDVKTLGDVITKPVHKDGNMKITKLQKGLKEVFKSPEKMIILAKIIESDFNLEFAAVKGATAATQKIRRSLENVTADGKAPRTAAKQTRQLADFFPE